MTGPCALVSHLTAWASLVRIVSAACVGPKAAFPKRSGRFAGTKSRTVKPRLSFNVLATGPAAQMDDVDWGRSAHQ